MAGHRHHRAGAGRPAARRPVVDAPVGGALLAVLLQLALDRALLHQRRGTSRRGPAGARPRPRRHRPVRGRVAGGRARHDAAPLPRDAHHAGGRARRPAARGAGAVRLQLLEREPAGHEPVHPGHEHHGRVPDAPLHLLRRPQPLLGDRRAERGPAVRARPVRPVGPSGQRGAVADGPRATGPDDPQRRGRLHLPEHEPGAAGARPRGAGRSPGSSPTTCWASIRPTGAWGSTW